MENYLTFIDWKMQYFNVVNFPQITFLSKCHQTYRVLHGT